jgi:hypothetical protein
MLKGLGSVDLLNQYRKYFNYDPCGDFGTRTLQIQAKLCAAEPTSAEDNSNALGFGCACSTELLPLHLVLLGHSNAHNSYDCVSVTSVATNHDLCCFL